MVDIVEFRVLKIFLRTRNFDDEGAVIGQHRHDAFHEGVQVADMVEGVGRDDRLRGPALGAELFGFIGREIADMDLDALFPGELGDIGGRIDAEGLRAHGVQFRQQKTVIAADVDDEIVAGDLFQDVGEAVEMRMHRRRARRDVEIVREETFRNLIGDLNEAAIQADLRVQREGRLFPVLFAGANEHLRRRVVAERQKQKGVRRKTGAAPGEFIHCHSPVAPDPDGLPRGRAAVRISTRRSGRSRACSRAALRRARGDKQEGRRRP